jgi:hypothetical protein
LFHIDREEKMVFATETKSLRMVMLVLIVAWMSLASTGANATATIQNIPPTPHHAPPGTPLADLGLAIKNACMASGWDVVGASAGSITARLRIRSHVATVGIRFDQSNYSIDYLNSVNLDFNPNDFYRGSSNRRQGRRVAPIKGPRIHGNYNKWVAKLNASISTHLLTPPEAAAPEDAAPEDAALFDPIMIADELEKLDALLQRGVLTQQEFDDLKAKLLK